MRQRAKSPLTPDSTSAHSDRIDSHERMHRPDRRFRLVSPVNNVDSLSVARDSIRTCVRSDCDSVVTALDLIEAGYAMLAGESFDTQTHPELLAVHSRLEAVSWKQPAITQKLIGRLAAETSPVEPGGKSVRGQVKVPICGQL